MLHTVQGLTPHLKVGSEEELVVPRDFIPAEVVCQEDDDVRLCPLPGPRHGPQPCAAVLIFTAQRRLSTYPALSAPVPELSTSSLTN